MPKNKKNNGGIQISGGVHVEKGDIIAGDKTVNVNKGGVFVDGNVRDSNIVTGSHNETGNSASLRDDLFEELLKRIEQRPKTSTDDQEDIKTNVAEIRAEAEKGDEADETFLSRRIRNIRHIAPDIADVVLATLSNPAAGFAAIVKKVAERAQVSNSDKS